MSYTALYRTYRPDDFSGMAGQKHIVKTLNNAIEHNQIAHAYLFTGPRGTGKTSSAKIFAKAINCMQEDNKPCGKCDSCIAASNGTHQDIIEIDAASNNGVEEARNLIERVKYAPSPLGKFKIYIIDEVHMMSTGAFNALLKTIEEPPAHVIFILATTEPHKVIPTIISRCQRFDFNKISNKEITKRLQYIVEEEQIQVEDKVLENIAILADGGMRDALSILDQCRAYATEIISVQDVNEIYGVISVEELCQLIQLIKQKNVQQLMGALDHIEQSGADLKRLTSSLIELLKESIVFEYTKQLNLLTTLNEKQVENLIKDTTTHQRLSMIDILMDTNEKYRQATSIMSYLEIGLLKLVELCPIVASTKEESVVEVTQSICEDVNSVPIVKDVETQLIQPTQEIEMDKQSDNIIYNSEFDYTSESEDFVETREEVLQAQKQIETIQESIKPVIKETTTPVVQEEKQSNPFKITNELILQLLVGANKPEKEKDMKQFMRLNNYLLDREYARYANLLKSSTITASANEYIVISVSSSIRANEINDLDKNSVFTRFTKELLLKPKKVFALTMQENEVCVELFKERYRANTLPQPIKIVIQEEKEEDKVQVIKEIFDEIIIQED